MIQTQARDAISSMDLVATRKTFVYKSLYHILRGPHRNVKCMAFTGITSILLSEVRNSHRTFGLQEHLTPEAVSNLFFHLEPNLEQ